MINFFRKIKGFFLKYEYKIVLVIAFCLISAISYEFGILQGQKWQARPLIIDSGSQTPEVGVVEQGEAPGVPGDVQAAVLPAKVGSNESAAKCAFVGSRNSDKFYLPTCSYAKRVKPENLVCFKTAEEAISQGRTESKCGPK